MGEDSAVTTSRQVSNAHKQRKIVEITDGYRNAGD